VGASLHLEKSDTLAYIAGYEERIGAFDRAAKTYRELADREETRVNGLIGLIRCQPSDVPAKKLIPTYAELVAALPDNQDFACDLAYLRLLAGEDVPDASAAAEKLLLARPNVLTTISTAALARLRTGNAKGALDLYQGKEVDWNNAAFPWRAVRCAVLEANGMGDGALRNSINPESLRPEERALLLPGRDMNTPVNK
jgi:lipopolysaccharide biosynthesis regulator YciM